MSDRPKNTLPSPMDEERVSRPPKIRPRDATAEAGVPAAEAPAATRTPRKE